ncbi:MAG: hypothetical protein M3094_08330 [Actinomycetia bacterium]|nr:hypothetical protein [Actinomycetes bacterium]
MEHDNDDLYEFGDKSRGKRWPSTSGRRSMTTLNAPRLISRFSRATGESLIDTVLLLLRWEVISIEWDLAKLEEAAKRCRVELTTTTHKITESRDTDIDVYYEVTERP